MISCPHVQSTYVIFIHFWNFNFLSEGRSGPDGYPGTPGLKGEAGESVFGPPGPAGLDGTSGLGGIKGEPGDFGNRGPKGYPAVDSVSRPLIGPPGIKVYWLSTKEKLKSIFDWNFFLSILFFFANILYEIHI